MAYEAIDDKKLAADYYVQASEIQKKVLGTRHADYLETLDALAALYLISDEHQKAEPVYLEMLSTFDEIYGKFHKETVSARWKLGFYTIILVIMTKLKYT